ncbi:MAG: tRNA pseudouridine(55) synthase TruB [Bacteroidetes bacterium]|nr:tRNA pseudouridine(55) synthase TruB [Bacteroidota bacterium]
MTAGLDPEAGAILLVDKPVGWTSFNVVAKVRAALRALTGHRVKVGHAGTLDPLASGLLVLGTGKCTKLLPGLTDEDKHYIATLCLGKETPSHDAETEVQRERPWAHIDQAALQAVLRRYTGPLLQRPPSFSAKRFQGERAYHLARAGEAVELPPVPVAVHALHLLAMDGPQVVLDVRCSKGTYIRALARDIGQDLGCGAHLAALRRTASGQFSVEDARTPEQWSKWLDLWAAGRNKPEGA